MADGDRVGDRRRRTRVASPSRPGGRDEGLGSAWFEEDGVADHSADFGTDLVSLGFIRSALRRTRRLRLGVALVGLLLGVGLAASRPPTPEASTTLLLTVGPEGQPGTAILTDQAMAQSRGVAALAARQLGSGQAADSILRAYKAEVLTDRILRITASGASGSEAARRADAIAKAFLIFRASQLREQDNLQSAALDAVLRQRQRALESVNRKITQLLAEPPSSSRQTQLDRLQPVRDQATTELVVLKNDVEATKATAESTTAAMVGKSKVLVSASQLSQSRIRPLILFGIVGLIFGLFLGAAAVIVGALVSDRVRRRDDVAIALGVPVRMSVAAKSVRRFPPHRRTSARGHGRDLHRMVAFLGGVLPTDSGRRALAVVPVDDTGFAAMAVIALAGSLAKDGARVAVADMCIGGPAARLVGLKKPGVETVQIEGAQVSMVIPDADDVAPTGPLGVATTTAAQATLATQATADYVSADVLLTLIALDPSQASDHLKTWATDAVVVVTAGRSSWTKIHAVGELIRLAGARLVCAALVGADKWDESLGLTVAPAAGREVAPAPANGAAEARPSGGANAWRFISR